MGVPHFLAIPLPCLGHINPLLQFSKMVAKHGCKVTFLNTERSHKLAMEASCDYDQYGDKMIKFVTLPDGLGDSTEEERIKDIVKYLSSIKTTMSEKLPELIEKVNDGEEDKISCIVVTFNMGWALQVGQKLGLKGAVFYPGSATSMVTLDCIPSLIHDGIMDPESGFALKKQEIQLSPNMPSIDLANLPWSILGKGFFDQIPKETQALRLGTWWLCNTTSDLEPGALSISPKLLPIGPFIDQTTSCTFWQQDTSCLYWLDQYSPQSVIYISFGSIAKMDPTQFIELALGLELLNRPFLWVMRPTNNDPKNASSLIYPHEFKGVKGKIVHWAPQREVLNHPAIACFVSHCGWNSTMEGVYNGVPFLCWPFFDDQFQNTSYICDEWKVGLRIEKDERGIITRGEINKKVEKLLEDEEIRGRSLKLKEMILNNVAEDGQSSDNLNKFINWAKQ